MEQQRVLRSLRLLSAEMVITSMVISVPILTVYFNTLGMNLEQVGLSQAAFTLGVIVCNIPSGHLADIFGRKWFNLFGDTIAALAFVYYAFFAQSFVEVAATEFILGIGIAFSGGADIALFESYCKELGYDNWQERFARVNGLRAIAEAVGVIVGAMIGTLNPRLAIAGSIVTYGIGALLSMSLVEVGTRRKVTSAYHKDLWYVLRYALHDNRRLKWSIIASAFAREVTHPSVWILTPILLLAGIPLEWVGVGWALNMGAVWLGNHFARFHARRFNDWQRVTLAVVVIVIAASTLAFHVGLTTIWLFGVFGLVRGWTSSAIAPIVQQNSPDDIKTSVSSISATIASSIYIPLVWWMGTLGDISPRANMAGIVLVAVFGLLPSAMFLKKQMR